MRAKLHVRRRQPADDDGGDEHGEQGAPNHARVSSLHRFVTIVETTGQSADPPKFITPAENTFAPLLVV
jgi:hypothetical protein